jgi:hypothetical protein
MRKEKKVYAIFTAADFSSFSSEKSNNTNNNNGSTSFRPLGIAYNQDEGAMYIASIGKVEVRTTLPNNGIPLPNPVPWYYPNTGVIWKIKVLW